MSTSPIKDDTPLRLAHAAEIAFPDGGMTASGLRKEAAKGRLVIERIAGKDYTTLGAIAEMRKLCRVKPKDQGSTSNRRERKAAKSSVHQHGSSETDQSSTELARARAKVQSLANPAGTPQREATPR